MRHDEDHLWDAISSESHTTETISKNQRKPSNAMTTSMSLSTFGPPPTPPSHRQGAFRLDRKIQTERLLSSSQTEAQLSLNRALRQHVCNLILSKTEAQDALVIQYPHLPTRPVSLGMNSTVQKRNANILTVHKTPGRRHGIPTYEERQRLTSEAAEYNRSVIQQRQAGNERRSTHRW